MTSLCCLKKLNDYADKHDADVVILIVIFFFQVVKLKIKFIVEMLNMYFFFVEYYKYLGSSSFITESFL